MAWDANVFAVRARTPESNTSFRTVFRGSSSFDSCVSGRKDDIAKEIVPSNAT